MLVGGGGMPTNFMDLKKCWWGEGYAKIFYGFEKKCWGGGVMPKYFMDLKKCWGGGYAQIFYGLEKMLGG